MLRALTRRRLARQAKTRSVLNKPDPLAEFDEYGTELRRDARVWTVYVEEADKYDKELVEGWKGYDFVFLIESSKKLQEDPADVSAQSLLLIAQALRELTNGTEGTTPASSNNTGFTPTRSAVVINTLWYLSLSLSLASAFISILAKDWCNAFLAGRTGHHYDQSQKRQKKWDMIERWWMPELVTILPSLIHGALLLFAIGLCIYLWDLNVTVAIPIVCVSGVATCFYVWSSIMAIIIDDFPYSTIISRVCRSEPVQYLVRPVRQAFQKISAFISNRVQSIRSRSETFERWSRWGALNSYERIQWFMVQILEKIISHFSDRGRPDATSRALSWLIKTCETPRSIDIALQSIAGAYRGIAHEPLQECKASLLILQRLASGSSYKNLGPKTDAIMSLYLRALSFLGEHTGSSEGRTQNETGSELEVLIWDLQMDIEKKVADSVMGGSFAPTKSNIDALRLGNTAHTTSRSLRLRKEDHLSHHHDTDKIDTVLRSIGELLESCLNNPDTLHDAALLSLIHAASLLSLFAPRSPAASALALPCVRLANSKRGSDGLISALASTCALVCAKIPDQNQPNPPHGLAWTERAVRALVKMHSQEAKALAKFSDCALQELVTHQEAYHIENLDSTVQNSLVKYNFSNAQGYEDFWVEGFDRRWDWYDNEAPVYLQALQDASDLTPATTPRPHAHLLVHEVMCRAYNRYSPSWDYCKQLISKCSFTKLSSGLAWVLEQREIIPLLERMRTSDRRLAGSPPQFFATGQLWLLFTLSLDPSENTEHDRNQLRHELHRYDEYGSHLEDIDRHERMGKEIEQFWSEAREGIIRLYGVWAYRLMECVLQSQNSPLSKDLHDGLVGVPEELRGLSSFTQWRPQPIDSSAMDAQPVEAEVSKVSDTVDRTPAATTEHATNSDHVADDEATATANEVRKGQGEGLVDVNAGHETTGEGGETAVEGQADAEAGNEETSRPESEDHGTTDGRQEMEGLMVGGGQGTGEEGAGTGDEGQQTRHEQNGTGEAERGSQPHIAIDIPDTDSAAK